jgi:hypothetical protein
LADPFGYICKGDLVLDYGENGRRISAIFSKVKNNVYLIPLPYSLHFDQTKPTRPFVALQANPRQVQKDLPSLIPESITPQHVLRA